MLNKEHTNTEDQAVAEIIRDDIARLRKLPISAISRGYATNGQLRPQEKAEIEQVLGRPVSEEYGEAVLVAAARFNAATFALLRSRSGSQELTVSIESPVPEFTEIVASAVKGTEDVVFTYNLSPNERLQDRQTEPSSVISIPGQILSMDAWPLAQLRVDYITKQKIHCIDVWVYLSDEKIWKLSYRNAANEFAAIEKDISDLRRRMTFEEPYHGS